MNKRIEELEAQLEFESQRNLLGTAWTPEYHEGYMDGLKQAIAVLKDKGQITIETASTAVLKRELKQLQAFLSDENSSIGRSDFAYEQRLIKELDKRENK